MIKNISELAENLGISKATLDRWIYQGKIPVSRRGPSCEFDLRILEKWAASRRIIFNIGNSRSAADVPVNNDERGSFLSDSIKIGGVFYNVEADDLESALQRIAGLAPVSGTEVRDALAASLIEREKIRSTGVGMGVAIPHPQKPMPEFFPHSFVTVSFLKEPIDFSSVDGKPVSVVFLLVASSPRKHLQMLSRLSYCLKNKDFMELVSSNPDSEKLLSTLTSIELQIIKQK